MRRACPPWRSAIPLASNQVEYSLLHHRPERNGCLRELGVTLIAYQPLASGALTGRYSPPTGAAACGGSTDSAAGVWRRSSRSLRCFGRSASDTGKTPAQVALRWLIENDIVLPIPGAKNRKQATEIRGADIPPGRDEIEALDTAKVAACT